MGSATSPIKPTR